METATTIELSPQQQVSLDRFESWLEDFHKGKATRPFFVLQGFAGTGKSFTINHIIEQLDLRAHFMAYTGKAALVLRKYSGVNATTIHSKCYKFIPPNAERMKELFEEGQDDDCTDERKKEIKIELADLKQPRFELNRDAFIDEDGEQTVDLLVLDECSMVDAGMLKDLVSFRIPIIALGDRGQLRPVKGTGVLFSGAPDTELTEIRRQALDSPIIKWSMLVRERKPLPPTDFDKWRTDAASKIPAAFAKPPAVLKQLFDEHDITICWKNATRMELNRIRRKQLGFSDTYPEVGEIIQLQANDKEKGLFNGQFGEITSAPEIMDLYIQCDVLLEDKDEPQTLKLLRARFDSYFDPDAADKIPPWAHKQAMEADFGYAITCHKAQGSQWDRVLVFEENVFGWHKPGNAELRAEWLYTAITRAAEKVTVVNGKW